MPELVGYLLLFLAVGVGFILVHLLVGKLVRPSKPHEDKLTIYECGEPTIGSAWVQFDVRFYVIALLFVIFDVEVAFFFPWAVVFGRTTELGQGNLPEARRQVVTQELAPRPGYKSSLKELQAERRKIETSPTDGTEGGAAQREAALARVEQDIANLYKSAVPDPQGQARAARQFSVIAFIDILVFFGVLLVGFAYLWKRGDLTWVRSTAAEQPEELARTGKTQELVVVR